MIPILDPASYAEFDTREYRHALGRFATGITIVTTVDDAGVPHGLTVNSFNSVSLAPPLILWSLADHSHSRPAFEACTHFAVNVLAHDQEHLSRRFAAKIPDKFDGVPTRAGVAGVPLLDDCCAWFECRNIVRHQGGDHLIFIGQVEHYGRREVPPLIYHGGAYHQLERPAPGG